MADSRKQINFRVDESTEALIAELMADVSAALGAKQSASDVLRMGLAELRKKYPKAEAPPESRKRKTQS